MSRKLIPIYQTISSCQECDGLGEIEDDDGSPLYLCNPAEDELTGPVEIGKEIPPPGVFPECCPLNDAKGIES